VGLAAGGAVALAVALVLVLGRGGGSAAGDWPAPNGDLSSTRAASGSSIDAASVGRLRLAWRFRFPIHPGYSGVFAATPLVLGSRVYLQDLDSNVYALDLATGRLLWRRRFGVPDGGPNGLGAGSGRIFGSTDREAFALDARTGALLWKRQLGDPPAVQMNIAPVVANGLVYTSTVGLPPGGKGAVYALDPATGRIRWSFRTVRDPWTVPVEAGGGGAWWPVSVDSAGRVYVGTANPYPYGGTVAHPNGGAYRGDVLYTDSLVVLDGRTGKLLWHDQVTPHDVRDYDFSDSPILAGDAVYGAGKAGRVIAWDRSSGRRIWETSVGVHRNDRGPLPAKRTTVCPGLLGGVETPMALAGGRLFVPVVDLCMEGSATGYESLARVDVAGRGTGEVVALDATGGRKLWSRSLPAPAFGCATAVNDVVVVPTFDGRVNVLAADTGRTLWQAQAPAGINACPAVAGDTLLVGAGTDYETRSSAYELLAFRLR